MARSWEYASDVALPSGRPVIGSYVGRIVETLSECLIPGVDELEPLVSETQSYRFLALYLRDQGKGARIGLKSLLVVFDLLPFLFIGRPRRFVNLDPQERELYLLDWCASRIYYRRMMVVLLKTIIGMGYYNDPRVLAALGFELPCGQEARP